MPILKRNIDKAVLELEAALEAVVRDLKEQGWDYFTCMKAPGTYKDLVKYHQDHGKVLAIEEAGCDRTIFSSPRYNHMLRFWHDVLHLTMQQDFTANGERAVINEHLRVLTQYGVSELAKRTLNADLWGQVVYYERRGKFVGNQAAFVNTCLQRGIMTAVMAVH